MRLFSGRLAANSSVIIRHVLSQWPLLAERKVIVEAAEWRAYLKKSELFFCENDILSWIYLLSPINVVSFHTQAYHHFICTATIS